MHRHDGARAGADSSRRRALSAGGDPGLIEGALAGRGGARPLLGVLRGADAIHHDLRRAHTLLDG